MKKLLFLTLVLGALVSTNVNAQAGDPPSPLQQAKEKQVPMLVEKAGLTEAQANRVIEINFEMRESMRAFQDLSEADRKVKIAEMKVARDKKYSEIPLTAEQITAVKTAYENWGKENKPQKSRN